MTTKKATKPSKATKVEAVGRVPLTLKVSPETYVRLSTLRAKQRRSAQELLTDALEQYLIRERA